MYGFEDCIKRGHLYPAVRSTLWLGNEGVFSDTPHSVGGRSSQDGLSKEAV